MSAHAVAPIFLPANDIGLIGLNSEMEKPANKKAGRDLLITPGCFRERPQPYRLVFTAMLHAGHFPSAVAVCVPGHCGQTSIDIRLGSSLMSLSSLSC